MLWYDDVSVAGSQADLVYFFDTNGKLYQTNYLFNETYSADDLYISAYNKLKEKFVSVYGPANEKWSWLDSNYEKMYGTEYSGLWIAAGKLKVVSSWDTDTSDILLGLIGKDYEISLIASYQDVNYVEPTDLSGI